MGLTWGLSPAWDLILAAVTTESLSPARTTLTPGTFPTAMAQTSPGQLSQTA